MSKAVYTPGQGFPARLRALLMRRNARPGVIERDELGPSADALARWMNGECCPEKQSYFNLCRYLGLSSAEGWNLLREKGEPALVLVGREEHRLNQFLQRAARLEEMIATLDIEQATRLAKRLRELARHAEARKAEWQTSTTTPAGTGS